MSMPASSRDVSGARLLEPGPRPTPRLRRQQHGGPHGRRRDAHWEGRADRGFVVMPSHYNLCSEHRSAFKHSNTNAHGT